MIKLPILLTVHESSWESAIGDALRTRTRLPYAKRRKAAELNKAYAHVSSPNFWRRRRNWKPA